MATFGEIVYSVLDLLKEHSDDAYYTEEHIIFLASKIRNLLLDRKYKNSRNSVFESVSDENMQQICLDVEPISMLGSGCGGSWLKSVQKIPNTLSMSKFNVYPVSEMLHSMVTYVPSERMPYVGKNKWLKNIIYCSRSTDGYLYMNSVNPNFLYLEKVRAEGVFSDPEEAAKLSCDDSGEADKCNILEQHFPLEDTLVPSCIEMVLQELIGSRYAPEDKKNDTKDGLAEAAVTNTRQHKPAENSTYRRKSEEEEE